MVRREVSDERSLPVHVFDRAGEAMQETAVEKKGRPASGGSVLAYCTERDTLLRSLKTALVIGTILALINHGQQLLSGQFAPSWIVPMLLTYLVPFCVATYGQVQGKRQRDRMLTASDESQPRQLKTIDEIETMLVPVTPYPPEASASSERALHTGNLHENMFLPIGYAGISSAHPSTRLKHKIRLISDSEHATAATTLPIDRGLPRSPY